MKTSHKIFLGLGIAAAGTAVAYRLGINNLQFAIDGYAPGPDGTIQMRIRVTNPSKVFGYPVPAMLVNAFDSTGSFVGTVINHQLQWIPANQVSYIYGTVQPNYQSLVSLLMGFVTGGGLPTGLTFHGMIKVWKFEIPFETNASVSGVSSKIGYTITDEGETSQNDSTYKWIHVTHGKKKYSFGQVTGKMNYVSVRDMNSPWDFSGKEFKNWEAVERHYKSPLMKAMVLLAEDALGK